MSWRIRVRHRTGHRYVGPVSASYNEARMTPRTADGQLTVEARLETDPPSPVFRYVDYWGTTVHSFDVHVPHDEMVVTAHAVVETSSPPTPSDCSWAQLDDVDTVDRWSEFLGGSSFVAMHDDFLAAALHLRTAASPLDALGSAVDWVRAHLEYVTGSTTVATAAPDAYAQGRGVCQDFAHVLLAVLRAAQIPARYASGYLYPDPDGEVGQTVRGESHAWVEAFTGTWTAVDPTNVVAVGERHVLVARGRDYADVAPLKGIYSGGPAEGIGVEVELTRTR